jgi:tetratricopeptide (TPR) repeat protein
MKKYFQYSYVLGITFIWCLQAGAEVNLTKLVEKLQPAVVTIITYDMNKDVSGIGSGFFFDERGYLITNYHVLKDAYAAEIKMHGGRKYPIAAVVAQYEPADLIKVWVDTANAKVPFVKVSDQFPAIAERIVVVGSPMGLDQTVSEGIISAIREMPTIGSFFQISAPISPGSSGSPVINMNGEVIGVATFQSMVGQNLNFAVSAKSFSNLEDEEKRKTLSEWTYARSDDKPRLAAELCRKGFQFSIQGENKKALQYYREATEEDPNDPMAWYGLGYCYAGLDKPVEAIRAYKQAIRKNPKDAFAHFNLAHYYDQIGRNEEAIESYKQVVRINPDFGQAYFSLGMVYTRLGLLHEGKKAFLHATELDPKNAPAFFFVGITCGRLGQYKEAIEAHRQVIRLNPSYAPAYYNLGVIHGKQGNSQEEVRAYKQALRVNPDYAPAHYKMGQKYLENGDRNSALAQYKILLGLDEKIAHKLFDLIYQ